MLFVISGGDLKCCELELPITSPLAMTRLYLVSQTSGLVSFGRKKYEEERKSLNLLPVPVPVPEGSVQPVRSVQIPVCRRCPDILVVCFDTTISPSKTSPRLTCLTLSLVCQPSFQVQCRRSGLLSYPNTFSQQFEVSLTTSLSVQMVLLERVNIFCSVRASGTAGQPGGRRGNPPVLGQDLCVVMWRSGGTSPSMRQTIVTG